MLVYWRVNCLEDLFWATWIWWQKSLKPQSAENPRILRMKTLPSTNNGARKTTTVDAHHQIRPSSWIYNGFTNSTFVAAFRYIFFGDWLVVRKKTTKKRNDDGLTHMEHTRNWSSRGDSGSSIWHCRFSGPASRMEEISAPQQISGVQGKLREALGRQFSSWWFISNPFEKTYYIVKFGSFPQVGGEPVKNVSKHHLDIIWYNPRIPGPQV